MYTQSAEPRSSPYLVRKIIRRFSDRAHDAEGLFAGDLHALPDLADHAAIHSTKRRVFLQGGIRVLANMRTQPLQVQLSLAVETAARLAVEGVRVPHTTGLTPKPAGCFLGLHHPEQKPTFFQRSTQ